jgi:hypothetical protein
MLAVNRAERPRSSLHKTIIGALGILVALASTAEKAQGANIYTYDASLGTLPEAQGFTRIEDDPDAPAPTVGGGVLHQFSQSLDRAQWWQANSVPLDFTTTLYTLTADLHVISSNYLPSIDGTGNQRSGYYLGASDAVGHEFAVGIASNGITINTDLGFNAQNGVTFTPFNTTDSFHLYRLVIDNGMGNLFIDGNFFAATPLGPPLVDVAPFIANRVLFGDASGLGVSETELRSFQLSSVPEPGSFVLLALGSLGAFIGVHQRRAGGARRLDLRPLKKVRGLETRPYARI